MKAQHIIAPVHLIPLLEIYASPSIENCPRATDGSMATDALQQMGLIEVAAKPGEPLSEDDHNWRVTPKGEAYVDAVLATRMPVQRWVIV